MTGTAGEPLEGEILAPAEVAEQHTLTPAEYEWGTAWTCSCGHWEAAATGPSSTRWARDDYARHVTESTRPKEPRSLP